MIKESGKMCCPCCHGTGGIKRPHNMQKNKINKIKMANDLKGAGYSIREIMLIMNYKSPRSVQDLLKEDKK